MLGEYQNPPTDAITPSPLQALAALVEELSHRIRSLRHQLVMLQHATPPPAPVALDMAAVEAVTNLDRIWFEHHPRRRAYVRLELEGEMPRPGVPPGQRVVVVVTQLKPGIRLRHVRPMLVYHAQAILGATEAEAWSLVS